MQEKKDDTCVKGKCTAEWRTRYDQEWDEACRRLTGSRDIYGKG